MTSDTKKNEPNIAFLMHPEYLIKVFEWTKFRFVQRGGDQFVERYVEKFSDAEADADFQRRKRITPIAGFAKAAIVDVRNSIYQRFDAIIRKGGTTSWEQAVSGKVGGVDLKCSTMNHFIGTEVLEEYLFMGKVGIYVDNYAIDERRTLKDRKHQHPYVYIFPAEDIRNWEYYLRDEEYKLKKVLLRLRIEETEPEFQLVEALTERYRLYWVDEDLDVVKCVEFDDLGKPIHRDGTPALTFDDAVQVLDIPEIPLVIMDMRSPLLSDIANHQIAATNMESADVGYALRANVPFYVEQYDQKFELLANQNATTEASEDGTNPDRIRIGATDGRRYPMGAEQPDFIHPSPEPLKVSMEKQKALKDDIRALVNLALSNIKSRYGSAESKELDERGLEAGLSAIGLELEYAERKIAEIWNYYEDSEAEITVNYPRRYSLKSDEERRKDAEQLSKSAYAVSSPRFNKAIQQQIAEILLCGKIPDSELQAIMSEIEGAKFPTADPVQIRSDVEAGLVSRKGASKARGYPEGEAEIAAEEKKQRELEIQKAQAKGFGAGAPDPEAAKAEKEQSQNPDNNPDGEKKVRGKSYGS